MIGKDEHPDAEGLLRQLEISAHPVETTQEYLAKTLTVSGGRLRDLRGGFSEFFDPSRIEAALIWPTAIWATRIVLTVNPAPAEDPPQQVSSRVSFFGTGWEPGRPVSLKWNNAFGFPGASIPLPDAMPGSNGFFAIDVVHKTVHKRHGEFYWEFMNQLVIVAQQKAPSGQILRSADQRGIPPHVIWQWVP